MYERHFGLRERPFSLLPDPGFMLLTRQHGLAMTMLEYGLESAAMISVLTGEVGSGKTTLVRHLLSRMTGALTVGLVNVTPDGSSDLLQWVALSLGLAAGPVGPAAIHQLLAQRLVDEHRAGRRVLIILDEAQNLSPMRLEELRLLTNLNVERRLVLQLLLVGQPELRDALRAPGLRQFVQRISVDYHLGPLDDQDAQAYVRHRLATAGGVEALIEEAAVAEAQAASGGIPRLINQLCAMALVYAYASGAACVDRSTMLRVIRDRLEGGLFPVTAAAGARREYVPAPLEPSCH